MRARDQEEQEQAARASSSPAPGGSQGMGKWMTSLESWLQPRPGLLLPGGALVPGQQASPNPQASVKLGTAGSSGQGPAATAGAGVAYEGRQAAADNIQAVIASSSSGRGRGNSSHTGSTGTAGTSPTPGPPDPLKDGSLTGPMLALPLLNSMSEQEWRLMEEAAVVAEAEQIRAGGGSGGGSKDKSEEESRARPTPVSHVGRVPLEVGGSSPGRGLIKYSGLPHKANSPV
jgi:hypothetical protein